MASSVGEAWGWLDGEPHHRTGTRLLRIVLGLTMLCRVGTEVRWATMFWGPHGWALPSSAMGPQAAALAGVFSSNVRVYVALAIIGVAGLFLVFGFLPRLSALFGVLPFWLCQNRLPGFGDAGDTVIRLLLIYSVLLTNSSSVARAGSLLAWIHNLGVVLIVGQACILYCSAALLKVSGRGWLDGTAVYVSVQYSVFSDSLRSAMKVPLLAYAANFGTLLLELWYPVALISKFRLPFILLVIVLHFGSIVGMTLITFGGVMIGLNLFVLTDAEYEVLGGFARRLAWRVVPERGHGPVHG